MTKTTWFEVYEFVDNDIINGTQTIEQFDSIEEADKFISEEQCKNNERKLFIDEWEMNEDGSGIAQRN